MKETFMKRAIELSKMSIENNFGGPFGSVIVKDQKIVAEGWNQVTSTNDPTAHGEVVAIRNACKELNSFSLDGCEIYTSCEPCPMCLAAIYWARMEKIYFANTEQDAYDIGFSDSDFHSELKKDAFKRKIPVERLLAKEAKDVFQAWAEKADKIPY